MTADDSAPADTELLAEQIEYYRTRAPEYDDWWYRRGRYDRGADHTADWMRAVDQVAGALGSFLPTSDVLELACGTGIWTEPLAAGAHQVTAVDASPEVIEINRAKLNAANVDYRQADLFEWRPDTRYDLVFFSFWLSHVPAEQFEPFWQKVADSLKPGGRAFFVDNLPDPVGDKRGQPRWGGEQPLKPESDVVRRTLVDGRQFSIVKIYYDPVELTGRLMELGWQADVTAVDPFFIYGALTRP